LTRNSSLGEEEIMDKREIEVEVINEAEELLDHESS
jgi:hypothetical protein